MVRSFLLALVGALLLAPLADGQKVTRKRRPTIWQEYFATLNDLDLDRVRIYLDGLDVTDRAEVGPNRVSFTPDTDLAPGEHVVRVVIHDTTGLQNSTEWVLVIDPEARDEAPPVGRFVGPTPPNGAVLDGLATGSVEVVARFDDGPGYGLDRSTLRLSRSSGGGPFEPVAARVDGDRIAAVLADLPEGTHAFRATAADRLANASDPAYTAFTVDRSLPELLAIAAAAAHDPSTGPLPIDVRYTDGPTDDLRSVELVLTGPGGRFQLAGPGRGGRAALSWTAATDDGRPVAAGDYRLAYTLVDYAGHEVDGVWPGAIRIVAPSSPLPTAARPAAGPGEPLPLVVDRVGPEAAAADLALTGRTGGGARVEVYVNDLPAGRGYANRSGDFRVFPVRLEPGVNRVEVEAVDPFDGRRSRRVRLNTRIAWRPDRPGEATPTAGPTPPSDPGSTRGGPPTGGSGLGTNRKDR